MFTRLLTALRAEAPGLIGESRVEWGSRTAGSRARIRESLQSQLPALDAADARALTDLSAPPRPARWSVSIAHTHDLGGWMALSRPAQIGWDVELTARIKTTTVERVSEPDELEAAPQPSYIWVAKEAFFKALEDEQPPILSALHIVDWRAAGADLWRWQGLGPRNADGWLLVGPTHLMAAALIV